MKWIPVIGLLCFVISPLLVNNQPVSGQTTKHKRMMTKYERQFFIVARSSFHNRERYNQRNLL
jgi:hypothetical protein